jgi:hypothetical protein
VLRYHRTNFFWDDPFTVSDGLPDDNILDLKADYTSNHLILTTPKGDFSYDESNHWWQPGNLYPVNSYPHQDSLRKVVQKLSGFIPPPGFLFFPEQFTIQDNYFRRFPIVTAFDDGWQNIWLGSNGLGAGFADLRTFRFHLLPWGLITNSVNGMAYDGESYWFGGMSSHPQERSGISRWNVESGDWTWYEPTLIPNLSSTQVTVIRIEGRYIWIGTFDQGVFRYDRKNDVWKNWTTFNNLGSNQITDIDFSKDWVWISTMYGVTKIRKITDEAEIIPDERLINQSVNSIRVQADWVWLATKTGIFRYDQSKQELDYIQPVGTGIVDENTTSISVFENEVWFGTSSGIQIYDSKKNEWKGFPAASYFFDGNITYLLADKNLVWAGTHSGLLRYNRQKRSWRYFDTVDGIADNHVQTLMLDGDYLWIGTPRGVTRFFWNNPDRIDD